MIKYFYYEEIQKDDGKIYINEKIIDEYPYKDEIHDLGMDCECIEDNIYGWYIDVEKTKKHFDSLDDVSNGIYNKLLIQQRNNKLNTLL